MIIAFYIAALIAVLSTVMVITRVNAVHALLYLIVSLLSVAVIFYILGAYFAAALEVIIYAGAIMVLFIFVVMMLNLGKESTEAERKILSGKAWIGPGILTIILFSEFIYLISGEVGRQVSSKNLPASEVGFSLFTEYILGVELAAVLLMAAIIGAYHIGRRKKIIVHRFLNEKVDSE